MNDPIPLRTLEQGPEGRAGQALEGLRRSHTWGTDRKARVWWGIRARATPRRRPAARLALVLGVGGGLVVALSLLVAGLTRPFPASSSDGEGEAAARVEDTARWNRLDLAEVGTVEVSASAAFEVRDEPTGRELRVASGTVRAQVVHQDPQHPVVVVTPQLRVVVIGTRFDVTAGPDRSSVEVLEGRVRVEANGAAVLVGAGEAIASDDRRLASAPRTAEPEPAVAPTPPRPAHEAEVSASTCLEQPSVAGRHECLGRLARGHNLAAQNALFTLGLLDRDESPEAALESFRAYQRRFPGGTLAAEAALRELDITEKLGRTSEAIAAAARFEQQFPRDPRAVTVTARRAGLLCATAQRRGEGRELVEALAARAEPEARAAANRLRARCDEQANPASER